MTTAILSSVLAEAAWREDTGCMSRNRTLGSIVEAVGRN
jgi:hypothetical protein